MNPDGNADKQANSDLINDTQDFPEPIIVNATQHHDLTIIFLHGRGFNASQFHQDLLDEHVPEYKSLRLAFPNAKFVFPNAPRMRAFKYRRSLIPQWYEGSGDWEMESLGNMNDSIGYLHSVIRAEIQNLNGNSARVVLGGFSQGCAMALMSLLLWDGTSLGGFIGISGFMPFTAQLLDIMMDKDEEDEEDSPFETSAEDDDTTVTQKAIAQLHIETEMPDSQRPSSSFTSTPIFMAHGAKDPEVNIEQATRLVALLREMGVSIIFNKYPDLTHTYSAAVLLDMIHFLKTMTK